MAASIVNPIWVGHKQLARPSNNQFCKWKRKKKMICCQSRSTCSIGTFTSNHGNDLMDPVSLVAPPPHEKNHLFSPAETTKPSVQFTEGIGIVKFLQGKHLLITGSTGFVAKVLVEKILRTAPDVDHGYTELFKCLKQSHRQSYQAFMLSKLVPVIGNLRESNLGIDADIADGLANQVDVIIHSAANTTFDESGIRQSKIKEKLFSKEDKETSYPVLDPEAETMLALDSKKAFGEDEVTQKMKQLRLERFDSINSQRLLEEMSEEEKRSFGFDLKTIDWTDYITNVHIPGLRRHVMKQK